VSKTYKNSPISEAVCEFQFGQDSPWDLTIPGLIYEKVRGTFPKKSQFAQVTLGISTTEGTIGQQLETMPVMKFSSEDEKVLIQVGTRLLSVNHLKPYSSWRNFLPLIQDSFNAYCEVAEPKSIHRIGLRYINTIEIAGPLTDLKDFFEFRPYVGDKLPQFPGPFLISVQLPFEEARDVLNLRLSSLAGSTSDTTTIILDIDYFLAQPDKVDLDGVFAWVDSAHTHVEEIFEACITEQLRRIFEE